MFLRFLRWMFTPAAPAPAPVPARTLARPASFFTSDAQGGNAENRDLVLQAVAARAMPVGPDKFRVYQGGTAMDSAGDLFSSAKAAFALHEGSVPDAQLLWYAAQSFIGFQMCAILAQQWLIQKACDVPARDAIRNGYKVSVNDGSELSTDVLDKLRDADERYRVKHHCRELVRMTRVFGIRIAIFRVDSADPKYYENPFNPDGVKPGSYKGIVQVDPYWCVPELSMAGASDPASPDFYNPTYWTIRGQRYHRSHLVIARGPEVADILKPSYQYAGVSLPQRIFERVYAAERTANEAPQLALSKRATFLYTDTGKALANESPFTQKLLAWCGLRDNYGVKVLDKEGDKAEQFDTTLSGFDETVMTQYQLVSAIAHVPSTKLLGTAPKGFNSTGDYEEATYHEELESIQANDMEPLVRRHHLLLTLSEGSAIGIPKGTTLKVVWAPLDAPTAQEEAQVELFKAQRDAALVTAGALDGQDVRDRLIRDPKSGYDGIKSAAPEPEPPPPMLPPGMPGPHGVPPPGQPPKPGAKVPTPPAKGKDAAEYLMLDAGEFDPVAGTYAEAQLLTNQTFLDSDVVADKIAQQDFTVELSPEFVTGSGQRYRIVIDGHHSLAAATKSGNPPVFVEANYCDSDYRNAMTQLPMFGAADA